MYTCMAAPAARAAVPSPPPRLAPLRLLRDPALAIRAAAGDSAAFAEIYRRHHQVIYRFCRSMLSNDEDAGDALQNTMVAAVRSLTGEQRRIELRPWLFRVARNECLTIIRARRPQDALDTANEVAGPGGTPERADLRGDLRELVADLQALPERQRAALVLRELSGLGYEEIAVALDTSAATAKQAVYEARTALQALAEGRAMSCEAIQRVLSDGDGRARRGRKIRAHLRGCPACASFETALRRRPQQLALIAPPLAAPAALALFSSIAGAKATGGAAGAAAAGGAATAAGVTAGSVAAAKVTAAVVLAGVAVAGGGYGLTQRFDTGPGPAAPASVTERSGTSAEPAGAAAAGTSGAGEPAGRERRRAPSAVRRSAGRRSAGPRGTQPARRTPLDRTTSAGAPSGTADGAPAETTPGPGRHPESRPGPVSAPAPGQRPASDPVAGSTPAPSTTPGPSSTPGPSNTPEPSSTPAPTSTPTAWSTPTASAPESTAPSAPASVPTPRAN